MKLKNILKEGIDKKKAGSILANKWFELELKKFGAGWTKALDAAYDKGRGDWKKKLDLDPKKYGCLQSLFDKLSLEVYVGAEQNEKMGFVMVIKLTYAYKHHSGSNGYNTTYRWSENKGDWERW
jgi:hypothetical protein